MEPQLRSDASEFEKAIQKAVYAMGGNLRYKVLVNAKSEEKFEVTYFNNVEATLTEDDKPGLWNSVLEAYSAPKIIFTILRRIEEGNSDLFSKLLWEENSKVMQFSTNFFHGLEESTDGMLVLDFFGTYMMHDPRFPVKITKYYGKFAMAVNEGEIVKEVKEKTFKFVNLNQIDTIVVKGKEIDGKMIIQFYFILNEDDGYHYLVEYDAGTLGFFNQSEGVGFGGLTDVEMGNFNIK